jgi:phage gp45-like
MTWAMEVGRLRAELLSYIDRRISQIFGWTLSAKASSLGDNDAVETADDDIDQATHQKSQRPVTRVSPFGVGSRPPAKLRSLWLRLGASNVVFIGIAPTQGYGPQDLDDGETAIYNVSKALLRLWKAGKITLDSDTGAAEPQDVVVNGGTLPVARKSDKTVADATMAAWIAAVTARFNAPAAPMVSAPGSLTPPTDFGVINNGAANFKG